MNRGSGVDLSKIAITGGTITGTNVPYVWVHYAIPIVKLPTTTYNNNGAATLGTALPTTYANFYAVVPANSIAAGVPAATDTYFAQASSTTAITLFNNRLADNLDANGGPTIPASPTAFVTTGAGSVAGVTAQVTLLTLVLPAASMSTTGEAYIDSTWAPSNTATAKTATIVWGSTNLFGQSIASMANYWTRSEISNRNSASVQSTLNYGVTSGAAVSGTFQVYAAENTANAVNIAFKTTGSGAATDAIVLERVKIAILK